MPQAIVHLLRQPRPLRQGGVAHGLDAGLLQLGMRPLQFPVRLVKLMETPFAEAVGGFIDIDRANADVERQRAS